MFTYTSIAELVEAAEKSGKKISELVLADQAWNNVRKNCSTKCPLIWT